MLPNKEEFKIILAFGNVRLILWEKYIKCVDPCNKLSVETSELMRAAFFSGVTFCMDIVNKEENQNG